MERPPCRSTAARRLLASGLILTSLAATGSLVACGASVDPGLADPPPHLVLVVVDALRRDHVGAYGYPRPTTPFLDQLGAEGVVFENAWAQASQTFNSTSTLLSSRYFPYLATSAGAAPVPDLDDELARRHAAVPRLAEANLTLPEVLRDAGYDTLGLFTNPHHHPLSGFWQGFDTARYLPRANRATAYARGPKVHAALFEWLDDRDSETPFFAYFHLMDVHAPYRPPRKLRQIFVEGPGRELEMTAAAAAATVPPAEDLAYTQALYDGEIRFVDGVIEALVDDLQARDLWRRTVLVVTSDHGDEFLDHGLLGHGHSLEPELVRIPLIVAGSGAPLTAGRAPALVRNLDLAPTLAELAGVEVPAAFEGTSLVPALRGEPFAGPRSSFAWLGSMRSLSDPARHFMLDLESGAATLYDLRQDPRGRHDLAASRPAEVAALTAAIRRLEARRLEAVRFMQSHPEGAAKELAPEIVEQLRALGYL